MVDLQTVCARHNLKLILGNEKKDDSSRVEKDEDIGFYVNLPCIDIYRRQLFRSNIRFFLHRHCIMTSSELGSFSSSQYTQSTHHNDQADNLRTLAFSKRNI